MFKVCKRFMSCLLVAALALGALTACGSSASGTGSAFAPAAQAQKLEPLGTASGTIDYNSSRVVKFMTKVLSGGKFYASADVTVTEAGSADTTNSIAMAMSGDKFYMYDVGGGTITITQGDTIYVLNVPDKTGYKITASAGKVDESIGEKIQPDASIPTLGTGTLTLDGAEYYFESSASDSSTTYYCFDTADTAGTSLRYFITESDTSRSVYKVTAVSGTVDENLFVVPADYTITDYSGMSFMTSMF